MSFVNDKLVKECNRFNSQKMRDLHDLCAVRTYQSEKRIAGALRVLECISFLVIIVVIGHMVIKELDHMGKNSQIVIYEAKGK